MSSVHIVNRSMHSNASHVNFADALTVSQSDRSLVERASHRFSVPNAGKAPNGIIRVAGHDHDGADIEKALPPRMVGSQILNSEKL